MRTIEPPIMQLSAQEIKVSCQKAVRDYNKHARDGTDFKLIKIRWAEMLKKLAQSSLSRALSDPRWAARNTRPLVKWAGACGRDSLPQLTQLLLNSRQKEVRAAALHARDLIMEADTPAMRPQWDEAMNDERVSLILKRRERQLSQSELARLDYLQASHAWWLGRENQRDTTQAEKALMKLRQLPVNGRKAAKPRGTARASLSRK